MKHITLGYKAFDLHELACHFVAASGGLYRDHGLAVTLADTRLSPDGRPDVAYSVACGAAALRWLRGEPVKVVFVATDRPMFWLLSAAGIAGLDELRGMRIASYPDAAPPACFLRIVLRDSGLVPGRDTTLEAAPDDASRLGMLRSGRAAAALISSAAWLRLGGEDGFRQLLCLGDRFRLPTTGLAVSPAALEQEPEAAAALCDCFRSALRLIHGDDRVPRQALREAGLAENRNLERAIGAAQRHFTPDGLVDREMVERGLDRLAALLDVRFPADPASLYGHVYRG